MLFLEIAVVTPSIFTTILILMSSELRSGGSDVLFFISLYSFLCFLVWSIEIRLLSIHHLPFISLIPTK